MALDFKGSRSFIQERCKPLTPEVLDPRHQIYMCANLSQCADLAPPLNALNRTSGPPS